MIYIIFTLIAYIAYQDYMNRKERRRLTDAFMAKDLTELNQVEKPAKMEEHLPIPEEPSILDVPMDVFEKAIKKDLGREPVGEKLKEFIKRKIHAKS